MNENCDINEPSTRTKYVYDTIAAPGICGGYLGTAGDLLQVIKPAGDWTCYFHDALHRLTDVGNSDQAGSHCKRFRYDNDPGYPGSTKPTGLTNTLGRLIEAATDHCDTGDAIITDEWFSYSSRGELTDVYEKTPNSGGYYHTTAQYWATGTLETLSGIPGVPTINYGATGAGLDGEGRITQVAAASGPNPVTGVTYSASGTTNPVGALTGVTFGSADSDSFTYDPSTGRMATYTFSVNSQTDKGTLTWNSNGTLNQLLINDQITGTSDSQTCNYTYDDLARIGGKNANGYSVDCGSTKWQQLFTYDAFGNITKSGTLSFIPGYSPTQNQFTSIPGRSVSYDGDGNLRTDNLNTYTWDVYGRMSTVNTGSVTVTATYDALDRVVEQYNGSVYTQILYSPVGKTALMSGSTLTKAFVNLPGGGTAIYNSSGLAYYRHSDHLGSSRLTSTQARGLYSSQAYAPFGEQYATYPTAGSLDPSYTGQNSDAVPSLYDFTFREHSMSQGRWISPDPLGMGAVNPGNPQTWNRYAYVANGPLNSVDPWGLNRQGPGGGGCNSDEYNCAGGAGTGNSSSGGDPGFTLDGLSVSASTISWLQSMGAVGQCPDNDCGPRIGTDGLFSSFYPISLDQEGWSYISPWGNAFTDGSEYGLGKLPDTTNNYSLGAANNASQQPYLSVTSDTCSATGRDIQYRLNGAKGYVWEILNYSNGSVANNTQSATLNGYPDFISGWGTQSPISQRFVMSSSLPKPGAPGAALQIQQNIGGWNVMLDSQVIQRTNDNIYVASKPCPK